MLITIKEYAEKFGKSLVSVRKKCARGGFSTARKMGRDWFIDDSEVYSDRRFNEEQEHVYERNLFSKDGESIIGKYYVSSFSNREILDPYGCPLKLENLDYEEVNLLENDIDAFEEGFNSIVDGYETMIRARWTIRRKVLRVEFNK